MPCSGDAISHGCRSRVGQASPVDSLLSNCRVHVGQKIATPERCRLVDNGGSAEELVDFDRLN